MRTSLTWGPSGASFHRSFRGSRHRLRGQKGTTRAKATVTSGATTDESTIKTIGGGIQQLAQQVVLCGSIVSIAFLGFSTFYDVKAVKDDLKTVKADLTTLATDTSEKLDKHKEYLEKRLSNCQISSPGIPYAYLSSRHKRKAG